MSKVLSLMPKGKSKGPKAGVTPKATSLTPLQEALMVADIARLLGNADWRSVFTKKAACYAPPEQHMLMDLATFCNEAVLDLAYRNLSTNN